MTTPQLNGLTPQEMEKLSRLALNLGSNPKTRAAFATLAASVDPAMDRAFPDVSMQRQFNAFKKQIEDERLAERMEKHKAAREEQKRNVIESRGLTADQVKEVEGILTHYQMHDWEAGADIYAQRNPPENPDLKPPPEMEYGGATWEFPTVPGKDGKMLALKDFLVDPRGSSMNAAMQVITEFKRNRLPRAFQTR